ncbi:PD-(D/E)XK nuclease family protein [Flavobacterium sp. N1736]|uniref:PD-(D/E)XK nuclease family protein n=1 Tax=Flavobacterium sp. N1736 TaxID=2986823 RepID=UPI0022254F7F|nr:PD-(D/E)XK nuclease family protein [Flavobacterium sp. N1736]
MTNQPNIFNYATSELTQDAFITWLLHWANSLFKNENEKLHNLGTSFLQSLVAFQNITIGEISELEIKQQFHKIDVFVTFKMDYCTYGIIIEDKIHSSDHSNQLERYLTKISELKTCNVIVPIYFKTGYQVNLSRIIENNYHHYTVKDLLNVITLEKVNVINNDLLSQYHSYLLKKENHFDNAEIEANNYLIKPIKDWKWWSCVRFFHQYKQHFNAGWGEVANNREALLAFWFGGKELTSIDKNIGIYMDIVFKHDRLRVNYRIYLKENVKINIQIRNDIYDGFVPFLKKSGVECRKAKYSNARETMLLAEITNIDGDLHYLEFVKQIEFYQNVLNEYADSRNAILV